MKNPRKTVQKKKDSFFFVYEGERRRKKSVMDKVYLAFYDHLFNLSFLWLLKQPSLV